MIIKLFDKEGFPHSKHTFYETPREAARDSGTETNERYFEATRINDIKEFVEQAKKKK